MDAYSPHELEAERAFRDFLACCPSRPPAEPRDLTFDPEFYLDFAGPQPTTAEEHEMLRRANEEYERELEDLKAEEEKKKEAIEKSQVKANQKKTSTERGIKESGTGRKESARREKSLTESTKPDASELIDVVGPTTRKRRREAETTMKTANYTAKPEIDDVGVL